MLLRLTKYNGDSGHVIKLEEECKTLLKRETCGSEGESQYRFLFGLAERPLFCRMCTKFSDMQHVEFCVSSTKVITDAWESGIPQSSLNEYWQQKRPNDYNGDWYNNSVLKNGIHPDGVVLTSDNKLPEKTIVHMKFSPPPSDEELFVTKVTQLNSMFNFRWMDVFFLRVMYLCFKQQLDNLNTLRLVKKAQYYADGFPQLAQLAQLLIHNICIYPSSSNDNYEDHSIVVKDKDDKYEYKFKNELVKTSLGRCLTQQDDGNDYVYILKDPDSVLDTIAGVVDFEKEPIRVVYLVFKANKQLFDEIFQSMVEYLKPVSEANVEIDKVTMDTLKTSYSKINRDFNLFTNNQQGGLLDMNGDFVNLFPPGRSPNDKPQGFIRKLFPDLTDNQTKKLRIIVEEENGVYSLLRYMNDLVSKYPLLEEKIEVLKYLLSILNGLVQKINMRKLLFRMYFFYNLLNPETFQTENVDDSIKNGGTDYFRLLYKLSIIEIAGNRVPSEKVILQEGWKQFFELGARLGKLLIEDNDSYDSLFILVLKALKQTSSGAGFVDTTIDLVGDISIYTHKIPDNLVLGPRHDLKDQMKTQTINEIVLKQITKGGEDVVGVRYYLSTDLTNTTSSKAAGRYIGVASADNNNSAILSNLAVKMTPPTADAAVVAVWKKSKNSQLTNHILGIDANFHQYRELQVI